jgi:excinuclease ABC subunit C
MHECVKRRYYKHDESGLELPDLIVVDGGKGQLRVAMRALKELKIDVSVVALAKQEEEVFIPDKKDSLKLPRSHKGLNLLRRARDEAHRFVIKYVRLLRHKEMML